MDEEGKRLVSWPIAAAMRKHYDRPLQLNPSQKRIRMAVRAVCALALLFLAGWAVIGWRASDTGGLNKSLDPWIVSLMVLGVIVALSAVIPLANAIRNWGQKDLWIWSKIYDVALAVACLGFTWFLWHWKMINFNLKY